MELILNKTYSVISLETQEDTLCKIPMLRNVTPIMKLPGSLALFLPKLYDGDVPPPIEAIVAEYDIFADSSCIRLRAKRYYYSIEDALTFEDLSCSTTKSLPQTNMISLYYFCQFCSHKWSTTIPLIDIRNPAVLYDAKPCPECGEPSCTGIYKITVDDTFDFPLYHGPLD